MVRRSRLCAGKGRSAPDENRRKRQKLNRLDAIASCQCVAHWEAAFALGQEGTADPGIRATGAIKLFGRFGRGLAQALRVCATGNDVPQV
jgi:hypothetical protein